MTIKSREILEQIRPEDKSLLKSQKLNRKFGREEDCVELHIYDLNGKLLNSVYNFENYEIPDIDNLEGFYNEITFNPDRTLRNLGYDRGEYELRVNFQRRKIANTLENLFFIDTISPSRTELRVKLKDDDNLSSLIFATNQFIANLSDNDEGVAYFKDFAINLGDNIILTGVNFIAEQGSNNSFLIKLYEPLPINFSEKAPFRIIEELTDPISYVINLGIPEITISSTELRGPNLRIDTRLNSSIPSAYKAYNDILSYSTTGSLNNVLNALSTSIPISVEFNNPNTDSGYVYDKFIHFSSAEERLRNFKYKLELVELYTSRSAYIDTLGNQSYVNSVKLENEELKNKVIQNFDNWERYLYYDSGAFSWPKLNSSKPHLLYSVTASQAVDFFNSQIENATNFDDSNPYILRNTVPQYIVDNNENEQFITFVDMVGQHFDNLWLYIENITDKNIAHNSLTEGISKDLVFEALKEKGIPAFDQFENSNLFEYLIASEGGDTFSYSAPSNQTIVSNNTEGSIPKGDISKEVWKRLYHNAPYLLKTKGTERGIKALLACYGIPQGVLHVKEYGGPLSTQDSFSTFKYPKLQYALNFTNATSSHLDVSTAAASKRFTREFTILPKKIDYNAILGSTAPLAIITSSIYENSGYFTGSFGESAEFPVYSGNPITFFVKNDATNNKLHITASSFIDNNINKIAFSVESTNDNEFHIGPDTTATNIIFQTSSFQVHNFKGYKVSDLTISEQEIHTKDSDTLTRYGTNLDYYAALGANSVTESLSSDYHFKDTSHNESTSGYLNLRNYDLNEVKYSSIEYNHTLTVPHMGMVSSKVRVDNGGEVEDNILSPVIKSEASSLDRQAPDYSTLGIFFSPTFEKNQDIIRTFGAFRIDELIGDPTHLHEKGFYPDLKTKQGEYKTLHSASMHVAYNMADYIKTIQYYDHTVFKIIEEFVPAKSNLKTGILIESDYFGRNPLPFSGPANFKRIDIPLGNISSSKTNPISDSEYILYETSIDVEQALDGSGGVFENNFVHSRLSSKYYRVAENR
jgi:hypothetical protein